ncbi:hypothetical protein BDN71DRAFT_1431912 [Pleurotus eryngii]|uniref:Uncharacterized protein n=1 Tax=Pleurotus eryngii TaxID=5323 RepID=A0A9P5ZUM3_PLEER|nr:hypothetical protein BDN71DRAFT_1431912 [Pleurotus eryngii]
MYDALQGHKQVFEKCNLLHHDGGTWNYKWDLRGTWDFMSIDLLGSMGHSHKISNVLESFLWVLLYYILLYLLHNKFDELKKIIYVIFKQYTNYYGEVKGEEGKYTAVMTGWHIGFDAYPSLEFTGNKPLIKFMQKMLIFLMNCRARETAAHHSLVLLSIFPDCSDYIAPLMPPLPMQKERQDDVELLFKWALG